MLRDSPSRAAWASAAAFAFAGYPFALHGGSRLLTEPLTTFLLLVATTFVLRGQPRKWWWLGAGLVLGLTALVRPTFVFLPFIVAAVGVWRPQTRYVAMGLLAAAVAVMAPWAVRTSVLVGKPSLLGGGGLGNSLHIAAWEYRDLSNGLPRTTDFEQPGFLINEREAIGSAQSERYSPRWQREVDEARVRLAVEQVRAHPWLYVRASLIRSIKLWVSQYIRGLPVWAGHVSMLICIVLLCLGIIGGVRLRPWTQAQVLVATPLLYVWLLHIPLHAEARYTLPVRPQLIIFAVAAAAGGTGRLKREVG